MNIIENKKRIIVIGGGTIGCLTVIHFINDSTKEITWYRDPLSNTQSVGEATTLAVPRLLHNNLNFHPYKDFSLIDGNLKRGIRKLNWGETSLGDYTHFFGLSEHGIHFNAVKFQNLIYQKLKHRVNVIEEKAPPYSNIEGDYIIDCSGSPKDYSEFNLANQIPVNSAYVVDCPWDYPEYDYSFHIALSHGWVFCIPLKNRMSVGYMYNSSQTTLQEIKKDINQVFKNLKLSPSQNITQWNFKNYYRKQNFTERVCYNGNSSFFLEPLESTSTAFAIRVNRTLDKFLNKEISLHQANESYENEIIDIQRMISLHYISGSKFNTPFWDFATSINEKFFKESLNKGKYNFKKIYLESSKFINSKNLGLNFNGPPEAYGTWGINNYIQNIEGLNLTKKLNKLLNI